MPFPLPAPTETIRLMDLPTAAEMAGYDALGVPFTDAAYDWLPIFQRAGLCDPGRPVYIDPGGRATYCLRATWLIKRPVIFLGEGPGSHSSWPSTKLWFPSGGGVVNAFPSATDPGVGNAMGSVFQNLTIVGNWAPNTPSTPHDGLVLRGPAVLIDVIVLSFGRDGIVIRGDGASAPIPSGAGSGRITGGFVGNCGRHGLYVYGRDASVSTIANFRSSDNAGVGIYDNSDSGSTYVGCVTHANRKGGYKTGNFDWPAVAVPPWPAMDAAANAAMGDWNASPAFNKSSFLNCYAEDFTPSDVRPPSLVLGGTLQNSLGRPTPGPTAAALSSDVNGVLKANPRGIGADNVIDPNNKVSVQLGSSTSSGAVMEFGEFLAGLVWRLVRRGATGWWGWAFGGQEPPLEICDTGGAGRAVEGKVATGPSDGSKVRMANGFYVGPSGSRVFVSVGVGVPTTGVWPRGAIRLHPTPATGGVAAWVCVEASSAAAPQGRWAPVAALGAVIP